MTALTLRRIVTTAAGLILVAGCGGSGPARYEVSGTVTYNGAPVKRGFITFSPDTAQGNDGPGGGAPIENGVYKTPWDKGVVGGPHRVRIVGYDGEPVKVAGEELADGRPLFPPFETTLDLPKQKTTHDFEVPKSAK